MKPAIITLLTDFGAQDYFVGAMKGVILSLNPDATIIDITHEIPPQDIKAAAFTLFACYKDFPAGTIHVVVVDPGVGSNRRPILVESGHQFFIGPNNGLFSWIIEREREFTAWQIANEQLFKKPVSSTFHGRDVFAPVAGALSTGISPESCGAALYDLVALERLAPRQTQDGFEGSVIHIDRFGNCITNFTAEHVDQKRIAAGARLLINGHEVTALRKFFSDHDSERTEIFMVIGSAGFIEIAAQNASAAAILSAKRGDNVLLNYPKE